MSTPVLLTLNGGSSSIKFSFQSSDGARTLLRGRYEGIGTDHGTVVLLSENEEQEELFHTSHPLSALADMLTRVKGVCPDAFIVGVGHRIVHGFGRGDHAVLTTELRQDLRKHAHIDPEHLPLELDLVHDALGRFPDAVHVACFDTVFHAQMPMMHRRLPLPARFHDAGIVKYGFHGLSCASILHTLSSEGPLPLRIVIAHLGSGASVTAVLRGVSHDTTMGYTPTGGILMSSRTGDMDPGTILTLIEDAGVSVADMRHLVNHESGLLGISGLSPDMRTLLAMEARHAGARLAVEMFVDSLAKAVAASVVSLGGVDMMVFAGGMGEHSSIIRSRVLARLHVIGIEDPSTPHLNQEDVHRPSQSPVAVRVIPTDEEAEMARIVARFISL